MPSLYDQVVKLAHDHPGAIREALLPVLAKTGTDWTLKFPSHIVMDGGELSKLYDRLSTYGAEVKRSRDPALQDHLRAMEKGLSALSTAMIRLRDAERVLYKSPSARTAGTGIGEDVYKLFPRNSYLYRYFSEADIPHRMFTVKDSKGVEHSIPNQVVVEFMAQTGSSERKKIEDTIRKIDFRAGDINHFLEHLAKALAEQYAGVLR